MTARRFGGAQPGAGRKPPPPLLGLTAPELALLAGAGEGEAAERAARRWLRGLSDLGVARLALVLEARPDLDARALVVELARRYAAATGRSNTTHGP